MENSLDVEWGKLHKEYGDKYPYGRDGSVECDMLLEKLRAMESVMEILKNNTMKEVRPPDGFDAECNDCPWEGNYEDMDVAMDDDEVNRCPECGSENVYYNR